MSLDKKEEAKIERDAKVRLKAIEEIIKGKDRGALLTSDQCRVMDYTYRALVSNVMQLQAELQKYVNVYGEMKPPKL